MKHTLLFLLLIISVFSFSQKKEISYDYYENGQVYRKGAFAELKTNNFYPVGLWQYWYEDGTLYQEIWYGDSSKTRYVNMWLPTGKQVLKNGEGFMYEVWPGGEQEADSTIFEIKDSIKQGNAWTYRLYKGGEYFLVKTGQYDQDSKKTGIWSFRDTVNGNAGEFHYKNGKRDGFNKSMYLNGGLLDSGQYKNDLEEGEWRFFDSAGKLAKVCNYKGGRLIGSYKEYYSSGQLKTDGTYRQGEGIIKANAIGANTGARVSRTRKILNQEYKTGKWIYYSKNGKVLRVEYHR